MVKDTISKQDWLDAQDCLGMAWYRLRAERETPTEADLFRMLQGQEIGKLARQLFPGGTLVYKSNGKTAAEVTQEYVQNHSATTTLFEAAAEAGSFVAKADILRPEGGAWHVLEVKSSFSDTNSIDDLVDDLAYTVMVLQRTGVKVTKASLVLLSRAYRFGDAIDRLFEILDKTDEVHERAKEFDAQADAVARVLFDPTQPVPKLVSACRECPTYDGECLGAGISHTVLEIPSLHHTKLRRLSLQGVVDIANLPNDLKLNPTQQRAVDAIVAGKAVVEPGLMAALQKIQWPCQAVPLLGFRNSCDSSSAIPHIRLSPASAHAVQHSPSRKNGG